MASTEVLALPAGLGDWIESAAGQAAGAPDVPPGVSALLDSAVPLEPLIEAAATRRDRAFGKVCTYSPKVFVDLTRLCRDRCRYCTFIRMPLSVRAAAEGGSVVTEPAAYLEPEEVLRLAEAGRAAGCKEALFTLGESPEERYETARKFLVDRGFDSTAEYVAHCARLVVEETGLLPHVNPGVMSGGELAGYRKVSASAGLMLESASRRLFEDPEGCHFGSPGKDPAVRLACIGEAGRRRIPFTTGILVGIGETAAERVETLVAIAEVARAHGHIQEVIVQNFRAKVTIPMRGQPEPTLDEMLRVVALARLLLPDSVAVQAPPNLSPGVYPRLLAAGLSDWGGISTVTPDHVNPEAPWPEIAELESSCADEGFALRARLCLHPRFVLEDGWVSPEMQPYVTRLADSEGLAC